MVKMSSSNRSACIATLGVVVALWLPGRALAQERFETRIAPVAMDMLTRDSVAGAGRVTAVLEGSTLAIGGSFRGLPSRATSGELRQGIAVGAPGPAVGKVTVAPAQAGQLESRIKLNPAQLAALRAGRMYVQVNSEKAPPGYIWGPKGTVWGWLLPTHEPVADGVPQQSSWYIPQMPAPAR